MKHSLLLVALGVGAVSGALVAAACSSSDSTPSGNTDSGTSSSSGTSGTPTTSGGTSGASGTSGMVEKDTCKGGAVGNSCQCSCAVTGQTENKALHCLQPSLDTGECRKVCCTGEIDSGGSSSGEIMDAGADG